MTQIDITFLFLGIAILLLLGNVLRPDIVALLLMLALGLSGILTPQESFSGFSRSAVIIMMSAFILAEMPADSATNGGEGIRSSHNLVRLPEFSFFG